MAAITTSKQQVNRGTLSLPGVMLRLEGLAVLAGAILLYSHFDFSWWMLALLFLLPDITFVAYTINPAAGSVVYNLAHTYSLPILLGLAVLLTGGATLGLQLSLIWVAHIAMDRAVGYGLKYPTQFTDTHLGRV